MCGTRKYQYYLISILDIQNLIISIVKKDIQIYSYSKETSLILFNPLLTIFIFTT